MPTYGFDYTKTENIIMPLSAAYASMRLSEGWAQNYVGVMEIVSDDADKGSTEADGPTVAQLDKFMSINNAVDLDLFGQVNAESTGTKHISGAGGQLDFVMGAYLSNGGKSFICCSSTFKMKDGTVKSLAVDTPNETAGLGARASETAFTDQFI